MGLLQDGISSGRKGLGSSRAEGGVKSTFQEHWDISLGSWGKYLQFSKQQRGMDGVRGAGVGSRRSEGREVRLGM